MGKLGRLMANKKGTSEKKRRLYSNVINSIVLYGAPIWAEEAGNTPKIVQSIRSVQRRASLRVIRAYKTISMEIALVMARNPPVELLAAKMKAIYEREKTRAGRNAVLTERGINLIRRQEQEKIIGRWKDRIKDLVRRGRVRGEFSTCFTEWVKREHGELIFWATQMITGHGCFRAYTFRIGKSNRMDCDFCEGEVDDNIHTLIECEGWTEERARLAEALGCTIKSLRIIIQEITRNERKWIAFMEFCGIVMRRKRGRSKQGRGENG